MAKQNSVSILEMTKEEAAKQVEAWKKEHGAVFAVDVEGHKCWLRKPTRREMSYATSVAAKDLLKFNELMLGYCWLDGDEQLKKDDDLFYAVSGVLDQLIEQKKVEIAKL